MWVFPARAEVQVYSERDMVRVAARLVERTVVCPCWPALGEVTVPAAVKVWMALGLPYCWPTTDQSHCHLEVETAVHTTLRETAGIEFWLESELMNTEVPEDQMVYEEKVASPERRVTVAPTEGEGRVRP